MQNPLQITFHGIDHSEAVETRVREKVAKLEQFFDRITGCRVAIESNHKNSSNLHHKGDSVLVRIDLTVPGQELVVKRESDEHEDVYAALKGAFQAMERQVKEYAERARGDVKARANG
ncbi:MAG: ribosome-associated translation inhibitor RaiA [Magnetospirillum sp.]